jgi:tetratricopeptide (TPR) repeat protein
MSDGKERSHGYQEWLWGLLLVVLTLVVYHPAWRAGFIWDDDVYVTGNPLLTAPDGLWRIWFSLDSPSQYFPLTYTTFYLERSFWGLNPAGYHWVNFLLHAANALLVWGMLERLRVPGAWLAAAVFALHPVQVESVVWITERKNVLMGFFFLLTLLAWIRFIEGQSKRPWLFYTLALFFYALALSAKTTACTLPAALILILWLKKIPVTWRRLAQVAPFVAMGIGMGLVTMWWERYHMGTQGNSFVIGPVERVLIAGRALWFYAGKLLWPANLTFSYPRWTISASDLFAWVWVLSILALGVVIWRARKRLGRGVEVAVLFFAVTLSPVLGFIMLYTFLYSFVADHYQYLACIGLIALAVAGMKLALDRVGARALQPVLGAALLAVLGALTWKQCGMYVDDQTLWQTTLLRNPNSWMAHVNLGNHLAGQGDIDGAIGHYQQALRINPNHWDAHISLGTALAQEGDVDGAITEYQRALQIYPNAEVAHVNLGIILLQKGQTSEAIAHFQKGLQIEPDDIKALKYLAWLRATSPDASLRDGASAVEMARRANTLTGGDNPDILHILAAAFAETGQFPEALHTAQRVLQMARGQSNSVMAGQLQYEMSLYRAGKPFHTPQ